MAVNLLGTREPNVVFRQINLERFSRGNKNSGFNRYDGLDEFNDLASNAQHRFQSES